MKCHGSIMAHSVCQRGWPQINTVPAARGARPHSTEP